MKPTSKIQAGTKANILQRAMYGRNGDQGPHLPLRLSFSRCLSIVDDRGNFCPCLDDCSGLSLKADEIILSVGQAVGQNGNSQGIPADFFKSESNQFAADTLTLQSQSNPEVFVCGDALTGPRSVVEAMASGREAACSADRLLHGEGLKWGRAFWKGAYYYSVI